METDRAFWRGKRVCVTGGTGLLGFQIVRQLLDLEADVRVLALEPHKQHPLRRELAHVDFVCGDIRDPQVVARALSDRDIIFHAAGFVAVWGPALKLMRDVHLDGTRNVLDAAPRSARVIHTSSVVAVGASHARAPLTEESAFELDRLKVDYVHVKRAAEQVALDYAARGRDVVVTNPGYLVGPEDFERSVMGRFCSRYWRGLVPMAPPGGFNLTDVRDCATGHLLAAERGQSGRRYIHGGENHAFPEFLAILAEVGRLRPRAHPVVPSSLQLLIASAAELRSVVTHVQPYPSLQHARLNRFYWFYRSDRAARELGFDCRPLAESLRDTYQWFSPRRSFQVRGLSRWWMRPQGDVSTTPRAHVLSAPHSSQTAVPDPSSATPNSAR